MVVGGGLGLVRMGLVAVLHATRFYHNTWIHAFMIYIYMHFFCFTLLTFFNAWYGLSIMYEWA